MEEQFKKKDPSYFALPTFNGKDEKERESKESI